MGRRGGTVLLGLLACLGLVVESGCSCSQENKEGPVAAGGPGDTSPEEASAPTEADREATERVRSELASRIDRAATPEAKIELARKLIDEAGNEGRSPAEVRALLTEARHLAVQGGSAQVALESIGTQAAHFNEDVLPLKAQTLEALARSAGSPAARREIADAALGVVSEARDARQLDLAEGLVRQAQALVADSGDKGLQRRANEADSEIRRLRKSGVAEARQLPQVETQPGAGRVATVPRGPIPGPAGASEGVELHVVGFYSGTYPLGRVADRSGRIPAGMVDVQVTRTGVPLVVALVGFDPIQWNVQMGDGVEIERVILCGYGQHSVTGLPAGTAIVDRTSSAGDANPFYAYRQGDYKYVAAEAALQEMTGLPISSFQGDFRYGGEPVLIGP